MIYRVILDGNDILNFQEREYVLLNPMINMELNTAGAFEFSMPPSHAFYDSINPITSTIEVYEDESLLWFGRPMEIKKDFFNNRQVYCEGALAFFNDSVQRLHEYDSISLHTFFRTVISGHNSQVAQDRRFTVGRITVTDKSVYRKLNYDSTFDCLKRQCLDAEGGYFFVRRENGVNYIDWLSDMPYSCNQPVEFGLNLLDLTSDFNGTTIATSVIPLGDADEETGNPLTVSSVNGGRDYIDSQAVSLYGRITRAVQFSGVKNANTLYADGLEYLQSAQFDDLIIECTAAELHSQNENYEPFRVGQKIRCKSNPHLLDRMFPLVKMSLNLDTAAKQITLGTQARQSLTKITKEVEEAAVEDPATKEEISEISTDISDINTDIGNINTDIGKIKDDITDIQNQIDGGGDGWTHQINGQSVQTGTINFVT
ncbi:MAG: phage tail protein [Mogibacterium sp.]|nr:phage tail protein [Mogibacterium sp.]